jgi:hypothetical protein
MTPHLDGGVILATLSGRLVPILEPKKKEEPG